jgi:hypothetical protein
MKFSSALFEALTHDRVSGNSMTRQYDGAVFVSEIINLRQARKKLARTTREEVAATNRARHGQTKAERALKQSEADKLRKVLDGAKREDPAE